MLLLPYLLTRVVAAYKYRPICEENSGILKTIYENDGKGELKEMTLKTKILLMLFWLICSYIGTELRFYGFSKTVRIVAHISMSLLIIICFVLIYYADH